MSNDKKDQPERQGSADKRSDPLKTNLTDLDDRDHLAYTPRIYLAGPLGFSEIGRIARSDLVRTLDVLDYQAVDPFALAPADEIARIRRLPSLDAQRDAWRTLNFQIGETNRKAIDACDAILAILDGTDVDSGTAAEIGYAYARGKPIVGYRGDFRLAADNIGAVVNLQVEYFIVASGGSIVTSIADIYSALSGMMMTGEDSMREPNVGPTSEEAAFVLDRICAAVEGALDTLEILIAPNDALGGRSPVEILRTEPFAARVSSKALETFGDARKAARWLCRPSHLLDGLRPLELLSAAEGARRVETILARIDYGVPP